MASCHFKLQLTSLLALALGWSVASAQAEKTLARTDNESVVCAAFFPSGTRTSDYRLRNTSEYWKAEFKNNWIGHTGAAVQRVKERDYANPLLMPDINFTLQRWPNHMDAIRALIQLDVDGGRDGDRWRNFASTNCYLWHARQFAPDDFDVISAAAYYHHRKGQLDRARAEYEEALRLNPGLAEAHYNLGLLYVELSDYKRAREHAREAYRLGYPLLGLRRQLEKAGQWNEPASTSSSKSHGATP